MPATDTPPQRRGRPRSAASEQAILQAALDLLAEGRGPGTISISEIARRAGAGKDTIYRRWSTKEDLLIDALAAQAPVIDAPPGVGLREALVLSLTELIARLQDERYRRIQRSLQGAGDEFPKLRDRYYQEVVSRRRSASERFVAAAIAAGELETDGEPRQLIQMPFHHVITRALEENPVTGDPRREAEVLVDAVLYGISAASERSRTRGPRTGR